MPPKPPPWTLAVYVVPVPVILTDLKSMPDFCCSGFHKRFTVLPAAGALAKVAVTFHVAAVGSGGSTTSDVKPGPAARGLATQVDAAASGGLGVAGGVALTLVSM